MTVKRVCCALLGVLLLGGCLSACGLLPTAQNKGLEDSLLPGLPPLAGELVSLQTQGNLLLAESIQPGLDTYDSTLYLYDLTKEKLLFERELGEGDWQIGLLQDGFYVISLSARTVCLYDTQGAQTLRYVSDDDGVWGTAMISADGEWLLYTDGKAAQVMLRSLKADSLQATGRIYKGLTALGWRDDCFYLGQESELLFVRPPEGKLYTAYEDARVNFVTNTYGVGTTEQNFLAVSATDAKANYLPFDSLAERPLAGWDKGFLTAVTTADGCRLRQYDLPNKQVKERDISLTVGAACYAADETLLLAARNKESEPWRLYSCPFTEAAKAVTVSEQDVAPTVSTLPASQSTAPVPDGAKRLDVPVLAQMPKFPTGCESVSAVMLLRQAGYDLSVDTFVDDYLDKDDCFYRQDGATYGPDPRRVFVGNPRYTASYGCMAPVIVRALERVEGLSHRVVDATGCTMEELCTRYIDKGIPVAVWVTIGMIASYSGDTWCLEDGSRYSWPANEHCMVLVGYDSDYYVFNDPYSRRQAAYKRSLAEKRYAELGMQAVALVK